MGSKIRRSSCSFLNLLLSFLNFILFILSVASLAPIISLKMPPTSLGYAFLMISSISIFSSFVGFYSQFCYITHVSLVLASATGQLLGILALFTKEKSSLSMLKSPRDPREAKLLVRLECGVLMAMFVMQMGILILCCAVHRCWMREYQGLEAEMAEKRRRNIARVQEESMARIAEVKNKEMAGENKYGKLMKNDSEA